MTFREAEIKDIPQMHVVRNSVKENALSNPALITDADYTEFMFARGKGWICEVDDQLAGFAIVDLREHNIWALFVHPDYEMKGIGKQLHQLMLDWYFRQTDHILWLGTAFNTRAETFYRMNGWKENGTNGSKEIRFEMSWKDWMAKRSPPAQGQVR